MIERRQHKLVKTSKNIGTDYALVTPLSQVKPEKVRWLWTFEGLGLIPVGSLTVLAGRGGVGKTSLVLSLVAALSRGELEGDFYGQRFPSMLCTPEDDSATVTVPRLVAAEADVNHVFTGTAITRYQDGASSGERPMRFPDDVQTLRDAVREHGMKLVLIDPATSAMRSGLSPNSLEDVRLAYEPLARLAAEEGCAVVLITHFNKGQGSAGDKLTGSTAWRDLARSVLLCAADTQGTGEVVLSVDKSNYTTSSGESLRYRLDSVPVPVNEHGEPVDVGRAVVLGFSDTSVQDLLNHSGSDEESCEIAEWVTDFLLGSDDRRAKVSEIRAAATKEGHNFEAVKRVKRGMGSVVNWKPKEPRPATYWALVENLAV